MIPFVVMTPSSPLVENPSWHTLNSSSEGLVVKSDHVVRWSFFFSLYGRFNVMRGQGGGGGVRRIPNQTMWETSPAGSNS